MTKREKRVINALINCVKHGEYSYDYACVLIEDQSKYGWLSEEAKEVFYNEFEPEEEEETPIATEPVVEPEEEITTPVEEEQPIVEPTEDDVAKVAEEEATE